MGGGLSARRRWAPALPVVVALLVAVGLTLDANLFFMRPRAALLHSFDEAYASALARRMLDGHGLPYVDGVSHRGPFFYWVCALGVRLFGHGSWMPMRALGLSCMLLTIGAGFAAACFARRRLAGAVMALVYVGAIAIAMRLVQGLAFGSEHVLNVFAMAALLAMTLAFRERRHTVTLVWLGVAGVASMLCALSKQVGIVLVVPFGLWVLAEALSRPELSRRQRWVVASAYAGGLVVPLLVLVLRYAVAGQLGTLYYYTITYNSEVYSAALDGELRRTKLLDAFLGRFDLVLLAAPLLGWALARLLAEARSVKDVPRAYASQGFELTVGLGALVSLLVSNVSLRDFGHYYVQLLPWAALLGGIVVERATLPRRFASARRPLVELAVTSAVLLPLAAFVLAGWLAQRREYADDPRVQQKFATADSPVCRFLEARTAPTDSIFIWGFDPGPYTSCNRRPASRYVYTTFLAGYVPWIDSSRSLEESRVVPGSREILLGELRREKPAVILDAGRSMGSHSLEEYPFLKTFVEKRYCKDPTQIGPTAWVENSRGCGKRVR